jgi:esterase/lipase
MSSEITETMLKFNDEKEKELNKEEEKLNKQYKQKLKDLIDSGGFHMEGITEIRMIIYLIQNCPDEMKPAQENMGKCLEILVNMSNQYLQLYKNENQELWNDENENEIE